MTESRTFRVLTFGCKVNQYESELLREQFIDCGLREQNENSPADLYIVNTCTVTVQADAKCRKTIRHIARDNPNSKIIVTGCYAERDAETLAKLRNVEAVIDNSGKDNLVEKILDTQHDTTPMRKSITEFEERTRAFIKIQDGCDEFCSYCIIPYVRGRPRSRKIEEILDETKVLVKNGYKEIVLTGIHIGCFGRTEEKIHRLPELIHRLENVEGLHRLRLSSIDPNEVDDDLVSAIAGSPIACRHLHISLQSGSTRILELMRRKYTACDYLDLTKNLYNRIPYISISTDVMVGFPGETEEDFQKSRDIVEKIRFSKVHIFPFSPREGTAAVELPDRIDPKTTHKRGSILASVSEAAAKAHREKFTGQTMKILVEKKVHEQSRYEGFTNNYLRTLITAESPLPNNNFVDVQIEGFDGRYLYGKTVGQVQLF